MFHDSIWLEFWETYEDITEEEILRYLRDPHPRVADAYEGREMILFLRLPSTIAVEAWMANYRWFLQRRGDELRVISPAIRRAETPGQLDALDVEYTEFVWQIEEASGNRIALTGGRVGEDPSLPLLVTDANKLRDFYQQVGAVYDGEDFYGVVDFYGIVGATVQPPPAPGNERSLLGT